MKISKEQLVDAKKANIEAVLKLGLLSLEHAERLVDLNLRNAKIALEHGTFSATALASVKDFQGLIALQKELADAGIQETTEYSRAIHRVAVDADGGAFQKRIHAMGIEQVLSAPRSPWQNPFVERLMGTMRRDCLDHVIVLNDRHLRHIVGRYLDYYHNWRTHLSLAMDAPNPRTVHPPDRGRVAAFPELGGLHNHYERLAA